jgi:hypothetical protein
MPAQVVIQVRRDSEANWLSTNPVLALGEIGFDTTVNNIKIGDGTSTWTQLTYTTTGFEISNTEPTGTIRAGDLWFKPTGAEAYIYTTTWVRINPTLADNEVTTAKINDGAVTTAKIAAGASIDRIANRRILVTGPTAPATPIGGWNVGDVWISY